MMAIQFTDFSKIAPQDSPLKDALANFMKGYQLERVPAQTEMKEQEQKLANSMKELALKHQPTAYALEDELKRANIKKAQQAGSGGGAAGKIKPNAAVANAQVIWSIKHPEGDSTPELRAEHIAFLEKAFQTQQEHVVKGTERTQVLNDTQYNRGLTQVSKKHDELRDIDEGRFPGTKDKLPPVKQKEMKNDLLLSLVKDTTDPATRTKLQNGVNMNITLDSIDPTKLTTYSGAENIPDKFFDQVLEGFDVGPKRYQDYVHEAIKASAAAKQMRQYLGDSIQPTAQERLDHLTNPSAWNVSPKVAKENFDFMRDLYKRETQTLVRAATDPSLYKSTGIDGVESAPQGRVYNLSTRKFE